MPKLVLSMDGLVLKEMPLGKERTTIGRKPDNDIQIDNLAISGHHAVITCITNDAFLEDQNSTNGTYINGRAVKKQLLQYNDTIEIGKYKIKYLVEDSSDYEKTMILKPGQMPPGMASRPTAPMPGNFPASGFGGLTGGTVPQASIRVLSGAAAGREVVLTKVVTTVGKPGVQVASITKRPGGYVFAHVEGNARPTVNSMPVHAEPIHLKDGDVIELAGTQMQFVQP